MGGSGWVVDKRITFGVGGGGVKLLLLVVVSWWW